MTTELKNQLLALSNESRRSFRKAVARRVREGAVGPQIQELKDFILVLPEMISQVRAWMENPETASKLKKLHGFMMTYLFHPEDFIPESKEGLFGYLDDAYFVGSLYLYVQTHGNPESTRFLPNMRSLAVQIPSWLALTKRLIPVEARRIDHMLEELRDGDPNLFEKMMRAE